MESRPENRFIPGERVSVDVGRLRHEMLLRRVRAVFEQEERSDVYLVLTATPEESARAQRVNARTRIFYSKAELSLMIPGDAVSGRYHCTGVEADTVGGNSLEFDPESARYWSQWYFQVDQESETKPMLGP